jgi:hypothetical protein
MTTFLFRIKIWSAWAIIRRNWTAGNDELVFAVVVFLLKSVLKNDVLPLIKEENNTDLFVEK